MVWGEKRKFCSLVNVRWTNILPIHNWKRLGENKGFTRTWNLSRSPSSHHSRQRIDRIHHKGNFYRHNHHIHNEIRHLYIWQNDERKIWLFRARNYWRIWFWASESEVSNFKCISIRVLNFFNFLHCCLFENNKIEWLKWQKVYSSVEKYGNNQTLS